MRRILPLFISLMMTVGISASAFAIPGGYTPPGGTGGTGGGTGGTGGGTGGTNNGTGSGTGSGNIDTGIKPPLPPIKPFSLPIDDEMGWSDYDDQFDQI